MARKSNQKKKGVDDLQASNRKSESEANGHGEASEAKVFSMDELPNGKNNHAGDDHKSKQKPKKQSNYTNPFGSESAESNGAEAPPRVVEETVHHFDKSRIRSRSHRQNRAAFSLNGFRIHNVLESMELPDNAATRRLKAFTLLVFKAVSEWTERHRPLFMAAKSKIDVARGYAREKYQVAYPVVLKWLMNVGNIMFLISMIWLDSAVRGVDSFLRMGTAAFFSVIWCSVFSVIAMAGIFKFLSVLAIAALIGVFVGFSLGILILGFSGAVFMWLYGSFWTTMLAIFLGGLTYALSHERIALLITSVYSVYCGWTYVGWLGLVFAFNLSFVSSDVLIYFLKSSVNQQRRATDFAEQMSGTKEQTGFFNNTERGPSETGPGFSADRSPGMPSTSGADSELTSDDEIVRLLNCTDHYSVLGLSRFESVDVSLLKREYKKKAMLVHPDKNMGNEKAVEAFKKLQNAYEVLLDSAKQKAYDDELRKEELLNIFRRFQSTSQKNGRHGFFASGMAPSQGDGEEYPVGESRRIACKKCNNFHVWILTRKSKSRARWCQECKEFHQAKDGDGWVEQSSQPLLFGLLQKVDSPAAFVCADSMIYDASEWYICQGMRCPANTHKPSFHVNTNISSSSKYNANNGAGKGSGPGPGLGPGQRGGRAVPPNMEEGMTEEDFFEWLQNAVQTGVFDDMNPESPSFAAKPGSNKSASNGSANKRKKKGKKQW